MVKIIEVHCCHMCKRFWLITGAIYDQFVEGISSNISRVVLPIHTVFTTTKINHFYLNEWSLKNLEFRLTIIFPSDTFPLDTFPLDSFPSYTSGQENNTLRVSAHARKESNQEDLKVSWQ